MDESQVVEIARDLCSKKGVSVRMALHVSKVVWSEIVAKKLERGTPPEDIPEGVADWPPEWLVVFRLSFPGGVVAVRVGDTNKRARIISIHRSS